jgi:hypothetical protein
MSNSPSGCVPSGAAWTEFYADWVKLVDTLVANNYQRTKYWSAWNEPNDLHWFTSHKEKYITLARALCAAVDRVKSATGADLHCVGPDLALHRPDYWSDPSFASADTGWLRAVVSQVGFDIVSIHWYDAHDGVNAKAAMVKAMFPSKRIWVTESAMRDPTFRAAAADPEFQEADLVTKWRALAAGGAAYERLFYYDLSSREGGITQGFHPRPAYFALQRLNGNSYVDPTQGNCSTDSGSALCEYTSWIPEGYGCRIDAYVRKQAGQLVTGARILALVDNEPLGYRLTNGAGVASFTARCDHPHRFSFTYRTSYGVTQTVTSDWLSVSSSNRVAVYNFLQL